MKDEMNADNSGSIEDLDVERYEAEQNKIELGYFNKCERYILTEFLPEVKDKINREYSGSDYYLDPQGFSHTRYYSLPEYSLNHHVRVETQDIEDNPYFAHVYQEQDDSIYIGKKEVPGWIVDWASPKAKRYYDNYAEEIGNEENPLIYVRDIIIKRGSYIGFRDQYNINGYDQMIESTDEQLKRILAANRDKKNVHDIIESIKVNQYRIISSNKDDNMLVLGCAGSGKTMVLMHKIRYMKYNNPDMKMSDVLIISPTDLLGRENKELAEILDIKNVRQFSSSVFYQSILESICVQKHIEHEKFKVVDNTNTAKSLYDTANLSDIKSNVMSNIENSNWLYLQEEDLQSMRNDHIKLLGKDEKYFKKMYGHYQNALSELRKYNEEDVIGLVKRIEATIKEHESDGVVIQLLSFLMQNNLFKSTDAIGKKGDEELKSEFFYTTKYAKEKIAASYPDGTLSDEIIASNLLHDVFEKWPTYDEPFEKMIGEWKKVTRSDITSYINLLQRYTDNAKKLKRNQDVLQYLLDNKMFKTKHLESTRIKSINEFKELFNLFFGTEQALANTAFTPFSYFEYYEKVERKLGRINKKLQYYCRDEVLLFDSMLSELKIEGISNGDIIIPCNKAFAMIYILWKKYDYKRKEKLYIYIDEFQDFSKTELAVIFSMFPQSIVNLFGDVHQCISVKGITDISEIPSVSRFKRYELNENYRNAKQITEYIIDIFKVPMRPIGLDGVQSVVEQIPVLDICEDDRVAVIVASKEDISETDNEKFDFYYCTETGIEPKRGAYNVIPVNMTKGLEFEKVIVIKNNMTHNQFYVACTRAIGELYVVI